MHHYCTAALCGRAASPPPNHQRPVCTNYEVPACAPWRRHAMHQPKSLVRLPRPTTKGQSALTKYIYEVPACTRARMAARHAPAKEALCASLSPTSKGQSALTTTDRRAPCCPRRAPPPQYHQRPVCPNYDGPARRARVPSPRPRLLWQAVQSSSKFGLGWWYSYSLIH